MNRRVALALAGVLMAAPSAYAAGAPSGPAATAFQQWFTSDRQLGCMNTSARVVACGPGNEPYVDMLYGNADGGLGTPDAVAIVSYLADPTGNGKSLAAVFFRRDGDGPYRVQKRLAGIEGVMVAPGSQARFGGGRLTVTMVIQKPGDSNCCPTGRKPVTLQLR